MAGAKFEYDESGSTFLYFLLSFELFVLIPSSYYFYPRSANQQDKRDKTVCHCDTCCLKNNRLKSKEPYRKAKERFIKILLFIGWILLLLTAYKVAHLQHDYTVTFDPFEILEIDTDASMAEIKKAYRQLSLIYHPDKHGGDEVQFMKIAKAYAALTNEESRKNWEVYGNPDGPGPTSFGIALPSWIVEERNSFVVLGLYSLVFMVVLPVGVGIWWYNSLKFGGSSEALLDTTQLFYYFIYKTPHMIFKRVLMILAASLEFEKTHNSAIVERETDNIEVPAVMKELGNVGEKNKERPLCFAYSVKARTLLHAHLSRLQLPDTLESDKLVILEKCPLLIQEFVACCSQLTMLALAGRISRMPSLSTMENAIKLSQSLIQALWDNKSSLLQLPHIQEEILRHFTTRKRNIRSILDFASMSDSERRNMLRSLTENQYQDVLSVLWKMPVIELEVKSEVLDDEDAGVITAGAIVTVTVNLIRRNISDVVRNDITHTVKEKGNVPEENVEKTTILNGDISPKGKKSKVWEKNKKKSRKSAKKPKKKVTPPAVKSEIVNKKEVNSHENIPNGIIKGVEKIEKENGSDESDDDVSSAAPNSDDSDHTHETHSKTKEKYDDDEDDKAWEKLVMKKKVKREADHTETKSKKSHLVHCPYFPDDKHEHWWVYISDKSQHSLITNPYFVTNLITEQEVELKFAAPLKPGVYCYIINVRSDSYIDSDVTRMLYLDVKEAKEVDITKVQWDISEEEEEKDEEESAVEDSDLASDEVDDE